MARYKKYKRLTLEDRLYIEKQLNLGANALKIAKDLGKSNPAIYREIKKGTQNGVYDAHYAEKITRQKRGSVKPCSILDIEKEVAQKISFLILQKHLSPEKILKILKENNEFNRVPTSVNTLYRAIDNGLIPNVTRESLNRNTTALFSKGLLHIPKWIREKMQLTDGEVLQLEIKGEKLVLKHIKK